MDFLTEAYAAQPHFVWLTFAALLLLAELIMPGVFLIWIGIAAAATGVITMIFGLPLSIELALFAVFSVISVYAGRRWYAAHDVESEDPLLNNRSARLVGKTVTVVKPVTQAGGRVKFGDGEWPAKGPDIGKGAKAKIVAVEDGVLLLEQLSD